MFGCNNNEEVVGTATVQQPSAVSAQVTAPNNNDKPSAHPQQSNQTESEATAGQRVLIDLLKDPAEQTLHEVSSQALQDWYKVRKTRPALILYSNDPFLQRTTPAIQKNVLSALQQNKHELLSYARPDAVLFPEMALDAALQAGFFSEVYWILPVQAERSELSIDIFRQQFVEMGALTEEGARRFTLRDGIFSGAVDGIPFHALHPQSAVSVKGPVVLHFDLSYFAPLYEKEMKTPIFPLIYKTLQHLRDQQLQAIATTFSYSQINRKVPFGSRFVADVLARLFLQPQLLDEPILEDWTQIANAMYLSEMLNVSMARDIYSGLLVQSPEQASLHYALYQASRRSSSTQNNSLDHLARAVQLDPAYAYEYLAIAPLARQKGRPDAAVRMLSLAHEAIPDDPFVSLELARAYLTSTHSELAIPLLQQLAEYSWSPILYPDIKDYLQQLMKEANANRNQGQ